MAHYGAWHSQAKVCAKAFKNRKYYSLLLEAIDKFFALDENWICIEQVEDLACDIAEAHIKANLIAYASEQEGMLFARMEPESVKYQMALGRIKNRVADALLFSILGGGRSVGQSFLAQ